MYREITMTARLYLVLVLLSALPALSQTTNPGTTSTTPATSAPDTTSIDQEQTEVPEAEEKMAVPPSVSGQAYPLLTGAEERSNYLTLGATAEVAYTDNVQSVSSSKPISDTIYSIRPLITLDRSTPGFRGKFTYNPGFAWYQPTTALNETDEVASTNLTYHPGPNVAVALQDSFLRSSSLFSAPLGFAGGGVSGGLPIQAAGALVAYADRISNVGKVGLTDQTAENAMFGLSGEYDVLDFPNPTQVNGIYNSTAWGGSAFAAGRISPRQYLGGQVQHSRTVSFLKGTDSSVVTDNLLPFYTLYLRSSKASTLSISVMGGPEHYTATEFPEANIEGWSGAGTVAIGWQGRLSSLAGSYSRYLTGGGGLPGAYLTNAATAYGRKELTRTWALNGSVTWANNTNETPLFPQSEPGGHSFLADVSIEHSFTRDLKAMVGYDRIQDVYAGIANVAFFPNANREYVSVTYQFNKPLGK